jgi:hypothetical protein
MRRVVEGPASVAGGVGASEVGSAGRGAAAGRRPPGRAARAEGLASGLARAAGRFAGRFAARPAAAALVVAVATLAAPAAGADLCSDCPKPTTAQVAEASGLTLGGLHKVSVTPGECTSALTGRPVRRERGKVPVWSAHGEAFHCPTGKATARISYAVGQDKRFEWSFTASTGLELNAALIATVKAEITAQQGGSTGASELGTIEQTIEAAYCQRNEYWAVFFASDAEIEMEIAVRRRWTWTVTEMHQFGVELTLATGETTTACGTGTVTANRLEPLFLSLGIQVRGCRDETKCQGVSQEPRWEGWFPPLPDGFDPFGPEGPFGGQPQPSDSPPPPTAPSEPTDPAPEGAPVTSEPSPAQPAPVEPTPVEPTPVEPAPTEPAPAPAPTEPTPVEPAPTEPAPAPAPTEPDPAPAPDPAPPPEEPAPPPDEPETPPEEGDDAPPPDEPADDDAPEGAEAPAAFPVPR